MVGNNSLASWSLFSQLSPSSTLQPPPPFSLAGGVEKGQELEKEKALLFYKCCSATAKTLLCYQRYFRHLFKTPYGLQWWMLTPSQPDPEQSSAMQVVFFRRKVQVECLLRFLTNFRDFLNLADTVEKWCFSSSSKERRCRESSLSEHVVLVRSLKGENNLNV